MMLITNGYTYWTQHYRGISNEPQEIKNVFSAEEVLHSVVYAYPEEKIGHQYSALHFRSQLK